MSLMAESATARRTTLPALASAPRSGTSTSGRRGDSGASARRYFAVLVGGTGACLTKPLDEGVEQRGCRLVSDLDLEGSAKARSGGVAVEHGYGVVDHAAHQTSVRVVEARPSADRRHVHARRELLVAHEPADELDRGLRRRPSVSVEDDLGTDEERSVALGRQLDRPALTGPVAQACSPAGESEVARVVVRRLVPLRRCAPHRGPAEPVQMLGMRKRASAANFSSRSGLCSTMAQGSVLPDDARRGEAACCRGCRGARRGRDARRSRHRLDRRVLAAGARPARAPPPLRRDVAPDGVGCA